MRTIALLVLFPAILLGCSSNEDPVCTTELRPGILVAPRDAVSDAPLSAHATGQVQDGSYTENFLRLGSDTGLLAAAFERPGTYRVTIEHEGYQTWTLDNVEVKAGVCHVNTVQLTAGLEPLQQ